MFAVLILDANNTERFYTGRAGRFYLSADHRAAFLYETFEGANRKAGVLNKMCDGLGYRFIATPAQQPQADAPATYVDKETAYGSTVRLSRSVRVF